MQEKRSSSALTMELHLSCTNPLVWITITALKIYVYFYTGWRIHTCAKYILSVTEVRWVGVHYILGAPLMFIICIFIFTDQNNFLILFYNLS